MSHIFDALRRSESERSGAPSPGLQSVTELLQRTEAQMQRESSTLLEEPARSDAAVEHRPASRQGLSPPKLHRFLNINGTMCASSRARACRSRR